MGFNWSSWQIEIGHVAGHVPGMRWAMVTWYVTIVLHPQPRELWARAPPTLLDFSWTTAEGSALPVPTDVLMGQGGGRGPTQTRYIFLETRSYSKIFEKKAHKHDILYTNCWCSVAKSCLTLGNPTDCSTSGFPVLHHLPEFAQTHVHWVADAIQPSHPLSSPSPPAFNLSQHPGLFQWVSSSHQVAKILKHQLQQQSFQWIFRVNFLWDWLVWSQLLRSY